MYEYLDDTMRRLAVESGIEYRQTQETNFFLEGCSERVIERLVEQRRQREAAEKEAAATRPQGNGTHKELVLTDVYGNEDDLNNDFLNKWAPGTTAANRRASEQRTMERKARQEQLVRDGYAQDVAFYMSYGYGEQEAIKAAADYIRRSRRSGGRGRSQDWTQGDEREYAKRNSASFRAGRVAGESIGLDTQVGRSKRNLLK
jgi:hypothetical protein